MPTKGGFAAGVVLTVPPFPYSYGYEELSKGEPICLRTKMTNEDTNSLHFAEVEKVGDHLITSGATGYIGVATGEGNTVKKLVTRLIGLQSRWSYLTCVIDLM